MEELYFWMFIISSILFVLITALLFFRLLKYKRNSEMYYNVACAGSPHDDTPKKMLSVSAYTNTFQDKDGNRLDVEKFNKFIASGESMSLCGIHDGDLVFTQKGYIFRVDEELPAPFVLKRRKDVDDTSLLKTIKEIIDCMMKNMKEETSQYKIRRGWKVMMYGKDDPKDVIRTIMTSEKFRSVIKENGLLYPGDDEIVKDFLNKRLPKYEKDYNPDKQTDIPDCKVLISTTLHTDVNKIYFSIHPVSLVVGKVLYSFTIQA